MTKQTLSVRIEEGLYETRLEHVALIETLSAEELVRGIVAGFDGYAREGHDAAYWEAQPRSVLVTVYGGLYLPADTPVDELTLSLTYIKPALKAEPIVVTYTAKVGRRTYKFYIRQEGAPNHLPFATVFPSRDAADQDARVERVKAQGFAVQYHKL
jgi:hypothetical protein